jgi:hypothetical protein
MPRMRKTFALYWADLSAAQKRELEKKSKIRYVYLSALACGDRTAGPVIQVKLMRADKRLARMPTETFLRFICPDLF